MVTTLNKFEVVQNQFWKASLGHLDQVRSIIIALWLCKLLTSREEGGNRREFFVLFLRLVCMSKISFKKPPYPWLLSPAHTVLCLMNFPYPVDSAQAEHSRFPIPSHEFYRCPNYTHHWPVWFFVLYISCLTWSFWSFFGFKCFLHFIFPFQYQDPTEHFVYISSMS